MRWIFHDFPCQISIPQGPKDGVRFFLVPPRSRWTPDGDPPKKRRTSDAGNQKSCMRADLPRFSWGHWVLAIQIIQLGKKHLLGLDISHWTMNRGLANHKVEKTCPNWMKLGHLGWFSQEYGEMAVGIRDANWTNAKLMQTAPFPVLPVAIFIPSTT